MFLSKHFALCLTAALFLVSADAVDNRSKRLRGIRKEGERRLPSKSSKAEDPPRSDGDEISTKFQGNALTDPVVVIRPQPVTPVATLEDWARGCGPQSRAIDQCLVDRNFVSNPNNCRTCLFGLGSLRNPPPAVGLGQDGVTLCANGPTCGACADEEIRGFYACGLRVNAEKSAGQTVIDPVAPVVPVRPINPITPITPITPVTPITPSVPVNGGVVDTINCPAVQPEEREECVFVGNSIAKDCDYPENSMNCQCNNGDPFWTCTPLPPLPVSNDTVVCAQDVFICPDGNIVSRSGPNCEFDCEGSVVCAQDVFICPDGNIVSRSGPNCEFDCEGSVVDDSDSMAMAGIDAEVNAFVP